MKLKINYDLLEKVEESKKGFSLSRDMKTVGAFTFFNIATVYPFTIAEENGLKEILIRIPFLILFHSTFRILPNLLLANLNKEIANGKLDKLAINLQSLNINTNRDLLLNTYKYKTTYKLQKTSKFIPYIKREKYLMIPINDTYKDEVSVLEEHIIGTREYELSKGEPQKVIKLAKQFA